MATYLDRILAAHRARAAADRREVADLYEQARSAPPARPFARRLRAAEGVSVIAEVKRASPSKGPIAPDLDPALLASCYQRGGAAALSVLTDSEFFAGSPEDLKRARAAVELPVLRKDFTVATADVLDARIMGADAVLLIVAALSPAELAELLAVSRSVGLDALVEVHDEQEAGIALEAGATLIGVNQRDLVSFDVDTHRAVRVAGVLPPGVIRVAESGIGSADEVRPLIDAGFDAVLVGESLVRSPDPEQAVRALHSPAKAAR
jgi:indole-3-glycerol phosphate synthase